MTRPIYETADIRRIEAAVGAVSPGLMVRAGEAAAALALKLLPEQGKDVLVLAGPGNNGGDAYEVATRLKAAYLRVTVVSPADAAKLPPDAAEALRKWQAAGGETRAALPERGHWSLVVD
ncbi:MAG: NAD(P)H-hydrate epimerase, partial [Burkholderiales bacterium]|nr:NAD(P)H-hydrate epimerase [Burkholderiales bacterium]